MITFLFPKTKNQKPKSKIQKPKPKVRSNKKPENKKKNKKIPRHQDIRSLKKSFSSGPNQKPKTKNQSQKLEIIIIKITEDKKTRKIKNTQAPRHQVIKKSVLVRFSFICILLFYSTWRGRHARNLTVVIMLPPTPIAQRVNNICAGVRCAWAITNCLTIPKSTSASRYWESEKDSGSNLSVNS
jgi:hypothetical protein